MSDPVKNGAATFAPVPGGGKSAEENAPGKVVIGSIDKPSIFVEAQFNPKELDITRSVPWSKTNEANKSNKKGKGGNASAGGGEQGIHLEFTGAEGRSLTLELLFDGYEFDVTTKKGRGVDVAAQIAKLEELASVREPGSKVEEMKRPHRCLLVWGGKGGVLPNFKCVIESLGVKYTMFSSDGRPVRATATVKLKEADVVSVAKKK